MPSGTVVEMSGGRYRVALDGGGEVEAALRGRLKLEERTGERVVVGDRVEVSGARDGDSTIEAVLSRERELVRRGGRGRVPKVVAANLDRLVVVASIREPEMSLEAVDRLLAVGEWSDHPCALVVNKLDLLGDGRSLEPYHLYRRIGYPLFFTSARVGTGMEEVRDLLCRGSSALLGPSGVGKSTILNAIEPELDLRTAEVGRRRRKGRHTTVSAVLLRLGCGGWVADTPGFSAVGLWGADPRDLDLCFPDFGPHREACRFGASCSHTHEPECGVRDALESGEVEESRYRSYCRLLEEAATGR